MWDLNLKGERADGLAQAERDGSDHAPDFSDTVFLGASRALFASDIENILLGRDDSILALPPDCKNTCVFVAEGLGGISGCPILKTT